MDKQYRFGIVAFGTKAELVRDIKQAAINNTQAISILRDMDQGNILYDKIHLKIHLIEINLQWCKKGKIKRCVVLSNILKILHFITENLRRKLGATGDVRNGILFFEKLVEKTKMAQKDVIRKVFLTINGQFSFF